jgi:hypothetical protein
MCSGICTTEKKVFQLKKLRFILFQVFDLRFKKKKIILHSVWIRIQLQTFFSDSDPQHW